MGEVTGMAGDPFPGQGFGLLGSQVGIFVQAAVALDLTHLLAHSCAEQSLWVGEGDADSIAVFDAAAPGDIAQVACRGAEGRDVHFDGGALAPGAWAIACDAAQADSVQPLAGNSGGGTLC